MSTIHTIFCGETYRVRANWADAAAPVEVESEDGWTETGRQVADYQHDAHAALRHALEEAVIGSWESVADYRAEIEAAVATAHMDGHASSH